jgi:release factor glutamine methyltransferase
VAVTILGPPADTVIPRLRAAGCVAAEDEAGELLSDAPDPAVLEERILRRERGEPLAWITGTTQFCGITIRVSPGLYVPRRQTEELARRAAALLAATGGRAADLCTGAGAVARYLQIAVPAAVVVGVDIDPAAVACARRNGVRAVVGDLGLPLRPGAFSLVTAVAPYVPGGELHLLPSDVRCFEPRGALDGGRDGLAVVRRVVVDATHLLRRGGWLLLEVGAEQDRVLAPTLAAAGFDAVEAWYDEDGDLRGVAARAPGPVDRTVR